MPWGFFTYMAICIGTIFTSVMCNRSSRYLNAENNTWLLARSA